MPNLVADWTLQERRDARSASRQCARSAPTQDALRKRAARSASARSAKREARSARREARSAKRVRYIYYMAGRAGFCSGRPASACRRCLTARPPSVARATGRPPRPRQLRERAPSLSHAARAGLLLQFVSRVGSGVRSLQSAPKSEAFRARKSRRSSEVCARGSCLNRRTMCRKPNNYQKAKDTQKRKAMFSSFRRYSSGS